MHEFEIATPAAESEILLARLRDVCAELGSVLVAYSGGVDSSVLLAVASEVLGDRARGAIADSETLPARELADALTLASEHGWVVDRVRTAEMDIAGYQANGPDRCFHCKDELFSTLGPLRTDLGFAWLAYGANLDDSMDHRPGAGAARNHGVRSPLVEAGFSKAAVRGVARLLGLANWDRPAFACLASRVQYGQPITLGTLSQVGRAEDWLRDRGFRQVRVRVHGSAARIEVESDQVSRLLAEPLRAETESALRAMGFASVVTDPEGYRRGSMNLTAHGGHRAEPG